MSNNVRPMAYHCASLSLIPLYIAHYSLFIAHYKQITSSCQRVGTLLVHRKLQSSTLHDVAVREMPVGDRLAIQLDRLDVDGILTLALSDNREILAAIEMQRDA